LRFEDDSLYLVAIRWDLLFKFGWY